VPAETPAGGSAQAAGESDRLRRSLRFAGDLLAICWFGKSATTFWRKYAARYIVF